MKLSRRSLMAGCAGAVSGLLVSGSGVAAGADKWVKPTLWRMETEALVTARPIRNPAIRASSDDGRTTLSLPVAGSIREMALNDAGRVIWDFCDGKHTVEQIAGHVQLHFDVQTKPAYMDTLVFLFHLKMFNAILV